MKYRLQKKASIAALLGAVCLASLPPVTQAAGVQGAIDFRQAAMNLYKWYLGPMGGMVKGKIPFDAAGFKSRAEGLSTAASLDLTEGFPQDSFSDSESDTDAKPEIRENWQDFTAKYQALREESAKLASIAAGGDMAAMKKQFGATAKTCKGCHDDYREK